MSTYLTSSYECHFEQFDVNFHEISSLSKLRKSYCKIQDFFRSSSWKILNENEFHQRIYQLVVH
uniref:Uncharacterized protein n=1 Tax=Rhizophagus irregularis (strain DAOM 181602 / DAOM 197198 / MUCL 43194) TaxID=747089 RepID=U9TWY4_RHIID